MSELNVNFDVKKTYFKIKKLLLTKEFPIITDQPPSYLSFKQGSIWGLLPRTAKKRIDYHLISIKSGTQIKFSSSFVPEWKKLTIIGYVFSFLLILLGLWINIDLENYIITGNPSYWSWIATSMNTIDLNLIQSFSNLVGILSLFLIFILIVETILVGYSQYKINDSAKEILNQLG
jgi:hypothetical protein